MKKIKIANEIIKVIVLGFIAFFLMNCNKSVKSEKELFDKNVSACASVFIKQNGMDSIQAIDYCSCILEKLITLDSGFVHMKEEERTKFINEMKFYTSDCDSILLIEGQH